MLMCINVCLCMSMRMSMKLHVIQKSRNYGKLQVKLLIYRLRH